MRVRDLKFISVTFGAFFLINPVFPQTRSSDLKHLLATQGFTGNLGAKDGETFKELGHIACGSKSLRVVLYHWVDPHPASEFPHERFSLIFIDGSVYLGAYDVTDIKGKPFLGSNFIRYPLQEEEGNRIECEAGKLPEHVLLNGEYPGLGK